MKRKIGEFIKEYSVRNTADEDIPVYSVTNENGFCTGYFSKDVSSKDRTTYKIVPRGCFAYNPSRINVGSIDWQNCDNRVIVSPLYVVFEVSDELDRQYLLHYLKSDVANAFIRANGAGSVRDNLRFKALSDIPIQMVPVEEQREIVKKIDNVSNLIRKGETITEELDQLVKSRFVELFGNPKINEKRFTKAHMGDYMTLLTDFSSNGSYKTLDSGVTMYDEPNYAWMVRTTDLESGDMSSIKYIDEKAYELLSKSKIYGGEIIMSKIGSAGKVYLMPEIDMPASLGRNAFMFRYDDRINVRFLFEQLVSEYGQAEIQQYVRGAVTKTITKDDVRSVLIIVPEKELQDEYVEFVKQVDKSKLAVQKELQKLEILKKSLMQQYFG